MEFSPRLKVIFLLSLIALGIAGRFLPHAYNFTPLAAIALFSSAYLGWRYALAAILAILLISDSLLGFYHWPIMLTVYASLLLTAGLGRLIKVNSANGILVGTLGASLLFYLATNFAVWFFGTMYPHTPAGLAQSYIMAIPFFRNSLAGDLVYSGLLFGTAYAVQYGIRRRGQIRKIFQPGRGPVSF